MKKPEAIKLLKKISNFTKVPAYNYDRWHKTHGFTRHNKDQYERVEEVPISDDVVVVLGWH